MIGMGDRERERLRDTERVDPREKSHARLKQTPVPKARDDVGATTADRLVILFRRPRRAAPRSVVRRSEAVLFLWQ